MSNTLNSLDLGNIESFKSPIGSDTDAFNFPGSGTNETEVYDYGDTKKNITIKGNYIATSEEALANWLVQMWALQNGDQDTIVLHLDFLDSSTTGDYQDGNILVKVKGFTPDYIAARVKEMSYSFELIESV